MTVVKFCGLIFILTWNFVCFGQTDFTPLNTFSSRSTEKWRRVAQRTKMEIAKINSPKKNQIAAVFDDRLELLEKDFDNKKFVDDSVLQNSLNKIWIRILSSNKVVNQPGEILISKSPDVNAFSYGEGTMIVNTGLIARLRNESQLAFVLAHELAHYELRHTMNSVTKQLESAERKLVMKAFARLRSGQYSEQDILTLKTWAYSSSSYQREDETAADSLGFIFFKNSGYRQNEAIELLKVLDSSNVAKYHSGERLFDVLSFASLPFKSSWLKDPPRPMKKDTLRDIFLDSIRTHPYIPSRIRNLSKWALNQEGKLGFNSQESFIKISHRAAFESVQGAFDNNRFDKCLFQALQLKAVYPQSDYITTMIGRVLLSFNIQRIKSRQYQFMASTSSFYKYDLRAVVNFLNNLDLRELGEITYRFINLKGNFNPSNEEHYFILWKICDITSRTETMGKVKRAYETKFPRGEYINDMKRPGYSKGRY